MTCGKDDGTLKLLSPAMPSLPPDCLLNQQVGHLGLEVHLAPTSEDGVAHGLDDLRQAVGADMGMGIGQEWPSRHRAGKTRSESSPYCRASSSGCRACRRCRPLPHPRQNSSCSRRPPAACGDMAARSFLRSCTSLPRSSTMGLRPSSISLSAANSPPGPAPTTMTCGRPDTSG